MTFPPPEIETFVAQLRDHYHAVGLADADVQADRYAASIAGMYQLRGESPEATAHFASLLELHRADLPFLEKRARISESIGLWRERKQTLHA
jgi:hypothetical protein